MEKFDIKIIRLKTGEDIICFCFIDYKNNRVYVKYPKTFYFNYDVETDSEELTIVEWMTSKAFALQDVSFDSNQILFTTYANISFGIEYLQSIIEGLDPESDLAIEIKLTLDDLIKSIDEEQQPNSTVH
jgi:hypothetical protein